MLITNFRLKYILYKLVLAGYQLLDTGRLHPVRERAIRALNSSVDYIDKHMADAMGFDTQKEVLAYAVAECRVAGQYLEFGVFTGGTIRYLAKLKPEVTFHGFDSFEGLPEAWSGFSLNRSTFSVRGKLPRVPSNVTLHKGWFTETVPTWRQQTADQVAFIHIDCDLYSSTLELLDGVADRLQPGTVIVFDEYFNYPNWERHEFKAWQEFVSRRQIQYDYLAFARQQVVVRIRTIGGSARP